MGICQAEDGVTPLEDPRLVAALAPLPGDAPDAASFRYDPQFEALENEIGKLERVGPSAIRWVEVARDAAAILATRSKDLTVACWLAVALSESEGLSGLATGLAIVHGLVGERWDGLFPVRPRARAGAVEWLVTRGANAVPAELPDAAAGEAAQIAYQKLDELDALLAEKLADAPALGELLRPLRGLAEAHRHAQAAQAAAPIVAARPEAAAASPAAHAPVQISQAATAQPLALPAIEGGDNDKLFVSLREAVRTVALQALEADLGEARAYQMLRAVTWLHITELPPSHDGHTELMAPPETRRAEFAALAAAGNGPELVIALERFSSASGLFWLDAQRVAATTLASMGGRFQSCSQAVTQGMQSVLKRLPGLPSLRFSDGTPFADSTTQAWLDGIMAVGDGAAAGGSTSAGDTEPAPWTAALQVARGQASGGQGEQALAALVAGGSVAPNGRERFLWQLAQASFCIENGAAAVAIPILLHLDAQVDTHGLEYWDPGMTAQLALMLHRALGMTESHLPAAGELKTAIFARLARVDPVAAARLASG